MKKRILRDPDTGEIVGATRAPFLKSKLEREFLNQKEHEMDETQASSISDEDGLEEVYQETKQQNNLVRILIILVAILLVAQIAYFFWN